MFRHDVAVIGIGMTKIGKHPEKTHHELAIEAIRKAILDARISKEDLDGLFTPSHELLHPERFLAQKMADYLRISPKSLAELECGGISGGLAIKAAMDEIMLDRNEVNLVYAAEKDASLRETVSSRPNISIFLAEATNRMFGSYDARYGILSVVPYYAMYTQRYMYEYDVGAKQIAQLPPILRENAGKNPYAQFREPLTVEDVLNSRVVCPPIHLLESCPLSDGAAAIVLASKEKAEKLGHEPILITGLGEFHDASHFMPVIQDFTTFKSVENSAETAFKEADKKPKDVDVAEVYGAFAGVELMIYEDLGFFKKGEAPSAVEEGKTRIDGEIAMNTSGGRLSLGHPWYVTPLLELIEVVLQLRGQAGERQVADAKVGLTHCEHGAINGSMVMILER